MPGVAGLGVPALCAFAVSLAVTPLVGRLAARLGVVAKPRPDRWAGRPVPMLGGLGIFIAVLAGLVFGAEELSDSGLGLLIGAAFLLVVGALDDRYAFRPQSKLIAQILGACIVAGFGVGFKVRPVEYFNVIISVVWIVAIINAINLMDNMDGLAPGVSLVASLFLTVQIAAAPHPENAVLAAALAGALGGFLVYNFPPARIFMGDAGSLSVGLLLSGLSLSTSLVAEEKLGALSVLFGPAVVLAVPILDVFLVSITRIMRGQPISQGGRDHSSHRLIKLGLSERRALLVFYALAGAAGLIGSQVAQGASLLKAIVLVPLSWIPLGLFFSWLAKIRVVEEESKPDGTLGLLVGWVFKRRMAEVLMDLGLAFASFMLAYFVRFDFHIDPVYRVQIAKSAPWVVGLSVFSLHSFGVYGGVWEHYGIRDIFRMGKAAATAGLLCIAVAVILFRFDEYPRSIFPLYAVFLFLSLLAVRSSFHLFELLLIDRGPRRCLVVGTGPEALAVYAHISAAEGKAAVAGFVSPTRDGPLTKLHGLPVYRLELLGSLGADCQYERIVVAFRGLDEAAMGRLRDLAKSKGVSLQHCDIRYSDA